jgi:hypothetical protein
MLRQSRVVRREHFILRDAFPVREAYPIIELSLHISLIGGEFEITGRSGQINRTLAALLLRHSATQSGIASPFLCAAILTFAPWA